MTIEAIDLIKLAERSLALVLPALTAVAVLIASNKHNRRTQKFQLTHTMRSQVYLEAAAEITAANMVIIGLAGRDLGKTENPADELVPFFKALTKAQMVSEPGTGAILQELTDGYGALFNWMINASTQCAILSDEITELDAEFEKNMARADQLSKDPLQMFKAHALQNAAKDLQDLIREKNIALQSQRERILTEFRERQSAITPSINRARDAIRMELELDDRNK